MFILDAHLDLAMNSMEWNRDLRLPVNDIRSSERGMKDKAGRAMNTVSLDAMRKGNIGICVATQIARYVKADNPLPGWNSPQQAWAHTQGQLAWYKAMVEEGEMFQITDLESLEGHLGNWSDTALEKKPIGFILSLEGADSIVEPSWLEKAYETGLRAIGPAHYGPGTYAQGTNASGGIGSRGEELLRLIEKLGLILDVTHLCDDSFWDTMNLYSGPLWASHSNCRSLVNHNRQFSDEQLKELIQREAVIGIALDAWMMIPGWVKGRSNPEKMGLTLEHMVYHIDHICQLSGNSERVGIGTDLDGGFGKEQSPADLDTIADLQKLPALLNKRGYSVRDIHNIMHGNFLRFLRKTWK